MKKLIYLFGWFLVMISCQKDVEIGAAMEIKPDYVLPQTGASKEANDRILRIYENYGTYVLYEYTQKDALWKQASGTASSGGRVYVVKMGDPIYVGEMLDYLDEGCWQFFSKEFLERGGMPYRVFLADSIFMQRHDGRRILYNYMITGNALAVAGMNANLKKLSATEKRKLSLELIDALWKYYMAEGLLDVPEKFYEGTDYNKMPAIPLTDAANLEAYRKRGFLPSGYGSNGNPQEWFYVYSWGSNWDRAREEDLKSYMFHIFQRTDEQLSIYLDHSGYELIQKKWNILINYYKEQYGLELRKIGNIKCE